MEVIEGVADLHPATQVLFGIFKVCSPLDCGGMEGGLIEWVCRLLLVWKNRDRIINLKLLLLCLLWFVFPSIPPLSKLTHPTQFQTATVYQIKSAQPIFAQQDDEELKGPLEDIVKRISKIIEDFGNFTRYGFSFLLKFHSNNGCC